MLISALLQRVSCWAKYAERMRLHLHQYPKWNDEGGINRVGSSAFKYLRSAAGLISLLACGAQAGEPPHHETL